MGCRECSRWVLLGPSAVVVRFGAQGVLCACIQDLCI